MALIRDISKYDDPPYRVEPINYAMYDGLVIRCYDGTNKDPGFLLHKNGAKTAGKPWWAYSFYDFRYPALPQIQAVLPMLQSDPGNLPLAFDVEQWGGHLYPGRQQLLDGMYALYFTYKTETGNICQFYMNPATIHYLKPIPGWLLGCNLWIANWGVNAPDYEPWLKWLFWQYQGEPDHNRFNGTDEEYWQLVNTSPPQPPQLPSKVRTVGGSLYVRQTPNGIIKGYVPFGTVFGVTGQMNDANGGKWWKVGDASYVASWWTENLEDTETDL